MGSAPSNGDAERVRRVELSVFRIEKGTASLVRFLGDYCGTLTHYIGKGVPCYGDGCPHCRKHLRIDWRGYAPAEVASKLEGGVYWSPTVIELTDRLRIYLGDEPLRGTVWKLFKRPGRRDKDECYGEYIRTDDPRTLRADIDVKAAVERMYHVTPMLWGCVPPFAAPQVLDLTPAEHQPVQQQQEHENDVFKWVPTGKASTMKERELEIAEQKKFWEASKAQREGKP